MQSLDTEAVERYRFSEKNQYPPAARKTGVVFLRGIDYNIEELILYSFHTRTIYAD
jgi:hypothetical protein